MTRDAHEFTRRFLLHVLPGGFHRIRHYGLLDNPVHRAGLAKVRELLDFVPEVGIRPDDPMVAVPSVFVCWHCGMPMIVIEILERTAPIRAPPMRRGETRADVRACRFAQFLARPLRHPSCVSFPLHHCVGADPASRLAAHLSTLLGIPAYQSP